MSVEAELADGRVLEFPDGTAPEVVQATVKKMMTAQIPQEKKLGIQDMMAGNEIVANLASGSIAAPLSGLSGIAGTLFPGPPGQGAKWTQAVGNALTYQPRTLLGEKGANLLAYPFELAHQGAQAAGQAAQDKLGAGPGLATAIQTGLEMIPSAIGPLAKPKQSPKVAAAQSLNEVRDATYAAAREEGYKFPPSATGGGFANAKMEGMAGRPMLNQESTLNNQSITNKIAAREAGLPENTAITVGKLEKRRQELAAPYREVAAIDPAVASDLLELRTARAEATKLYKFYDVYPNPMIERKANRLMDKAEALEGYIEDAAKNAGKPDLVDRLRTARREIAKTYDIESALNEGSANVNAARFGALLDKGKPLSGGLETIAKAYQAFRPYMGDATNIRNPGVERSRGAIGLAANAAGMHGGVGWFADGLPLLAGPTRSVIMSDAYQNAVGKPTYPANPLTRSVLEEILLQAQQAQANRK